ncbi:LOW QUALITY PROTEIN: opticin [Bombina bombina]|uniref:LOW QUALITY PROTEIN: opticin n=1 Tax=Bombina bombina TaxID=8345 RepID=UPI00235A520C|nr:LOW QUALITY PROTEIN: opticin [Bombina bombina]
MQLFLALCLYTVALCVAPPPPPPETGRRRAEKPGESVSYENLDLDNYDLNLENNYNYEDLYDYTESLPKFEVGTLAPLGKKSETLMPTQKLLITTQPPVTTKQPETGLFGSMTEQGLPTCLVCVCLGSSTYCDDTDCRRYLPLPKDTVYLYARFNKITHVRTKDFAGLDKLKYVDLSSNTLSQIDSDAFSNLPALQELILSKNELTVLPGMPLTLIKLDARQNQLKGYGFQTEDLKDLSKLKYLYLSDNKLDYIPVPLPLSLRSLHLQNNNVQIMNKETFCDSQDRTFIRRTLEDIRLDGNPIILSNFAESFFCLPRLPIGQY